MTEWTLHHQPHDCRADHEYSFWLGDEIVVMANPIPGHKDKIEFMLKAVSHHDALVAVQQAAYDYFMCAVQDEADDLECCCTERQHELAKALRDTLRDYRVHVGGSSKP